MCRRTLGIGLKNIYLYIYVYKHIYDMRVIYLPSQILTILRRVKTEHRVCLFRRTRVYVLQ